LKYSKIQDGVEIEFGFKAANTKYSKYQWVQTVRTNSPRGTSAQTYNDPPNDGSPFYHTASEYSEITNTVRGNTIEFFDGPFRSLSPYDVKWRGELSLVGLNNGTYTELHTFNYGFNITNGKLSVLPLISNTPTEWHLKSF
jgi:hypothetical protein